MPGKDSATATLVINSDYSYCSACGGGASAREMAHTTLLGRETAAGWVVPSSGERNGCGAMFVATATDSFDNQAMAHILEMRPDLPFHGKHESTARG